MTLYWWINYALLSGLGPFLDPHLGHLYRLSFSTLAPIQDYLLPAHFIWQKEAHFYFPNIMLSPPLISINSLLVLNISLYEPVQWPHHVYLLKGGIYFYGFLLRHKTNLSFSLLTINIHPVLVPQHVVVITSLILLSVSRQFEQVLFLILDFLFHPLLGLFYTFSFFLFKKYAGFSFSLHMA